MQFGCPSRFRISLRVVTWSIFDRMNHLQSLGCGRAVKIFSQRITQLIKKVFVEQPLALPGSDRNKFNAVRLTRKLSLTKPLTDLNLKIECFSPVALGVLSRLSINSRI